MDFITRFFKWLACHNANLSITAEKAEKQYGTDK